MITGRQTLAYVDQALGEARAGIGAAEAEIETLNQQLVALQATRAQDYKELARVRLGLLDNDKLAERLDRVEQQLVTLLDLRADAFKQLESKIAAADAGHLALEQERAQQAEQVDTAAEAVDDADARTQARLDADPDYRAQRERAHAAERKAAHAREKAQRSAAELEAKGASYRGDPLFMYLWKRKYGLPAYQASGLIRWLDGKVARHIGFADARANFDRLNEIPERLHEHADVLQAAADAEFAALQRRDSEARTADGVTALEQRLAEEQAQLDALDDRLERAEAERQTLFAQKAAFANGDDEHTRKAVQFLAAELQRDELQELRHDAMQTPFPDDDLIVHRLSQHEDERTTLEASIEGLRGTIRQQQTRLQELESLRTDFKRKRYDRAGSVFGNNTLIAMLLGEFLKGMLDRKMLWKVLQEQQRFRPRRSKPTFGSGGFGRGTVWGGGLGDIFRGGGGGGGFGGRSRGGGGGFRTGGGF